jgi:hypothetical protein
MGKDRKESGVSKAKRGTQNELEIIGIIIMENHVLRKRVFEVLKKAKQDYIRSRNSKSKQDLVS